jgi:hypothetical protein
VRRWQLGGDTAVVMHILGSGAGGPGQKRNKCARRSTIVCGHPTPPVRRLLRPPVPDVEFHTREGSVLPRDAAQQQL